MEKNKMSKPAIFMHSVIIVTCLASIICFTLYYGNIYKSEVVLWTGITAFTIMYHFWMRIIMGNVTKLSYLIMEKCQIGEKQQNQRLLGDLDI